MAINPLSVPNYGGPYSGGVDFAPLGDLVKSIIQRQQEAAAADLLGSLYQNQQQQTPYVPSLGGGGDGGGGIGGGGGASPSLNPQVSVRPGSGPSYPLLGNISGYPTALGTAANYMGWGQPNALGNATTGVPAPAPPARPTSSTGMAAIGVPALLNALTRTQPTAPGPPTMAAPGIPNMTGAYPAAADFPSTAESAAPSEGPAVRGPGGTEEKYVSPLGFSGAGQRTEVTPEDVSRAAQPPASDRYTASGLDRLAASIRKNESSGNYANVTTTTNPRTGQRQSAIGAYGIMDFNVGPWTREVLGQAMTPQQFLSSPGAQDAVAKAKLGQYASKYGLSGAARAWIGGEGNMYGSAPDAFGTTPSAYAARVTRDMGLPPEITQGRSAGTAPGTEGQAMGLSAPPSVAAGPGVAQLAQNTGQFGGITRDQLVQLARNPVTADLARQIVARQISPEMKIEKITDAEGVEHLIRVPVQGPAGDVSAGMLGAGTQGAESPETAGLTGEDYLKTLDSGRANLVKAIAEGRSPMPSLSAKSPQVRSLARDVMRYEPGMDSALWRARNTAYTSATSGKIAQNYASFETALSHINQLDSRIDALNNSNIQPWNAAANRVKRQYDPNLDTALKQFEIDKNAAVAELTRAFRGTGGNVHDLKEWEDTLSSAGSPQALHAAIREGVELLRGRMEAVSDEYNRAMQSKVPIGPDALLEPKYKEIFNRLGSISVTPKGGPTITEERPQTVIQNGHTYTRQPDGSYK